MTITLDPGFIWSVVTLIFMSGAGWAGLHLSVRWLERKQDIKLAALKEALDAELAGIKEAHTAHVQRYEREHGELRQKVDAKGEHVTDLTAWRSQFEKRIDEKIDEFKAAVTATLKSIEQTLLLRQTAQRVANA